ncbi:hypothetical protein ARALYDRAFT_496548 [Arabidopsis lyrata subsp. lyrata]|uniref:Fe2OG dioxygenase domain-containing protein n=1 Tax=Arabidopsis lyrata subsp. lyrata TaxID=81972 RepID=D7MPQ4_ARALL|nr:hypothetical protein ARALYDRAFT_496548 [Arabidopsis lyrata subsp. lyrata]
MEKNQHISSPDIPVIDLCSPDEELVAIAVVKASQEWGIFQVVNHGIPTELILRLQQVGKEFFELPETEKEAILKVETHGWIISFTASGHRLESTTNSGLRILESTLNEEYASHIKKLSEKIMEWLSEGLGLRRLRREALKEGLGGETVEYLMKINYYPPCPDPELVVGAPDHTDVNGITLLVANEALGLQAFKDNQWIDAKYTTSGIIVIIGDQFLRMSNGKYKSVEHRAKMDKEKTRISWPVFVESSLDHVFGPLPELITGDENIPNFKPYVYKDYKFRKLKKLLLE